MADYSINAVARKVSYTGSAGVGPYAFSFEVLDQTDVAVYFNETLLTLTTDYSVTVNANGTGSVTLVVNVGGNIPATPDADDLVIIVGARDIERTTDFVTAGDLRASALNEQLDALTIMVQQVAEEVERSVKAPVYDPTGINMILPKKSDRVNAFVAFDANGDISAAVPSDDVTTLAAVATDIGTLADIEDGTDATDAIQTVAGISGNVTTVAGISGNVTTVAGANANISTVATDLSGDDDIGTVAGAIANINTVAGIDTEITTVAGDAADIATVAGISSDVSTVATNVADVTNFADVYIGAAASDPATRADSSALQAGDLYFNTTDDDLKVYTGSAWTVVAPTATSITESQISDLGDSIVLDTDIGSTVQAFDADNAVLDDDQTFTGDITFTGTSKVQQTKEKMTISATAATGTINYDALTQSVLYFTSDATDDWTVNVRGDGSNTLNSIMSTGEALTVVFLVTQGSTAYYNDAFEVDGSSVTPKWQGGDAPTEGTASGIDAYTYNIIKTADATFTVLASIADFA